MFLLDGTQTFIHCHCESFPWKSLLRKWCFPDSWSTPTPESVSVQMSSTSKFLFQDTVSVSIFSSWTVKWSFCKYPQAVVMEFILTILQYCVHCSCNYSLDLPKIWWILIYPQIWQLVFPLLLSHPMTAPGEMPENS